MRPSETTLSDLLYNIEQYNTEIDNTILIGEKVAMINEAGRIYNQLKSLATPDYFSDEECAYLKNVAQSWNDDVLEFSKSQNDSLNPEQEQNLRQLEEDIREALEDLFGENEE